MDFETQAVEWKSSWRDEYLKWVCGFANAQGGVLEIGKDDNGEVLGVADAKRLLTEIPNKINSAMAILADVDLKTTEDGLDYLVVAVRPYPYPISYHGKYYLRSGATNRELTGPALDDFILRRQGKTWDGVPVPYVTVDDLDIVAFRDFRRMALASERLTAADLEVSNADLVESLQLTDGSYLKRAAILLFHETPEKWVMGCQVRIGYFETGADLVFHDEVRGPIISMADKVLDILYAKYFRGRISYEGIQRIETYPVAKEALREAILNAVVHRDYSSGAPIQIKVFPDHLVIYCDGGLPPGWTLDKLLGHHDSIPRNPGIANAFFRSGQIETWGRGIEKIEEASRKGHKPIPVFEVTPYEVNVTFPFAVEQQVGVGRQDVEQDVGPEKQDVRPEKQDVEQDVGKYGRGILQGVRGQASSRSDILTGLGLVDDYRAYRRHILPLVEAGLLARTNPDNPRARNQRYALTDAGRRLLAAWEQQTTGE
jgi:ATP-dependent DNA helicase RecG